MRKFLLAFFVIASPAAAQPFPNQCHLCGCCGMPDAGHISVIDQFRHGRHHAYSGMR